MYILILFIFVGVNFMNTKFISDTIIDTEYSKLGIMDINPSRSTIMVITKTCINDNQAVIFPADVRTLSAGNTNI